MFGIINLGKPAGPTSRDCVNHIQRLIRPVKVGHAGTLDPIASGVLLILVGQASRLTDYVHNLDKEYIGTFQLGVTSPSADTETDLEVIADAPVPTIDELVASLPPFRGTISQMPPIYSAIRIDGKRAYDLARSGATPDIPSRQVTISELEIVAYVYPRLVLRIVCSTGTYIRSIGRDLARSLESDAIMTDLIRTRIGPFANSDSVSLESMDSKTKISEAIQSPLIALESMPKLTPNAEELQRLKDGQHVRLNSICTNPDLLHVALDLNHQLHSLVRYDSSDQTWKVEKYFPPL
ncbi:MAG: tRNA pseudouridine(55) synthase TruB [Pirellula sp.]|nr:tRNA pseudouridine(55) synthase TruB [Pirellula sp.]